MVEPTSRIEARRDRAIADLRELDRQVADGEIDETTAARLRTRYETDLVDALDDLAAAADQPPATRSRRRVWVGVSLFAAAAIAATVAVTSAIEPRPPGGFATGGVASDVVTGEAVDLSEVTNDQLEEVVAANPDIIPMRLALARRYVEGGDFSSALPHYLYVLDREDHPEALMYVGWMTYLSGDPTTGASLLERSLVIRPDDPLAQWFLANARFHGLGDRAGAVPLLEAVATSGEAPPDIVEEAQQMIAEAGS